MKIYVVGSSKNRFLPLDNIREKFLIDKPHEGDNIDNLNPWYCELTGLYYLWKHVDDDIVGLEHYRRYFANKKGNLLSEAEIREILKTHDVICKRQPYTFIRPPITWFQKFGKYADIQKFLCFVKVYVGKEYYDVCIKHLHGDYHCLGNMLICHKELLNEYCDFIFDVTFTFMKAEKRYGRKLTPRIIGYFTEFLLGAWLIYKRKKIKFLGIRMTH